MINDATLKENIAFGIPWERIDDSKVLQCIALAHLSDVLDQLPEGLNTPMGDRGMRLSGGQRQRVAIARALYNDPDILVLDEATSALDTLSERAIRDALLGLHGKITIISIAHSFSTIMFCDCIFLMARGKVVAQGTFDALMRESELFRELASGTVTTR
jgi:HlyD family secretion protein